MTELVGRLALMGGAAALAARACTRRRLVILAAVLIAMSVSVLVVLRSESFL
jgi:hypothetical protein